MSVRLRTPLLSPKGEGGGGGDVSWLLVRGERVRRRFRDEAAGRRFVSRGVPPGHVVMAVRGSWKRGDCVTVARVVETHTGRLRKLKPGLDI